MFSQLTTLLKLFCIIFVTLICVYHCVGEAQHYLGQDDVDDLVEFPDEIDDFTINRDTDLQCANKQFCYSASDKCCGYTSPWWGALCRNGKFQSPINLPTCKTGVGNPVPPLIIAGDGYKGKFQLTNDGQAAVLQFSDKKTVTVSGAGSYTLDHIRFHWASNDTAGSEHCIKWVSGGNCVREAMELQLMHYKADKTNLTSAIESGQRNAVLGVSLLLRVQDGQSSKPNEDGGSSGTTPLLPVLNPVLKHLEEIPEFGASVDVKSTFDLTQWLAQPNLVASYFGSMTTPKCKQVVRWYVFQTPMSIKAQDIAPFRVLKQEDGQPLLSNRRPMQKRNKREIQCYQLKQQNAQTTTVTV